MLWAEDAATLDKASTSRVILQSSKTSNTTNRKGETSASIVIWVSMETSRVFVQGLPPNLSSEDFQKHFSKISRTTDTKLFPHRRIGYVGYSSHDEACRAVKYFNKSYIRMSRIKAELAKPVASLSIRQALDQEQVPVTPAIALQRSLAKQKHKYDAVVGKEGPTAVPMVAQDDTDNHSTHVDHGNVEDRQASKRQKTPHDQPFNTLVTDLDTQGPKVRLGEIDAARDSLAVGVDEKLEANGNTSDGLENPPASDADWLRSRTSRLLGLLDDEEVQEPTVRTVIRQDKISSDDRSTELHGSTRDSAANAQTEQEVDQLEAVQPDNAASEDTGLKYNRLFIRNLAYDITEMDLRAQFEQYGSLHEVSNTANISTSVRHPLVDFYR